MSLSLLLGSGAAGGLGAIARFLVGSAVAARSGDRFPYWTVTVNLSGSFVLGVLVGAALHGDAYQLLAVGFLGGYTTFSTWAADSRQLVHQGDSHLAAVNFVASLVFGFFAIWTGRLLG